MHFSYFNSNLKIYIGIFENFNQNFFSLTIYLLKKFFSKFLLNSKINDSTRVFGLTSVCGQCIKKLNHTYNISVLLVKIVFRAIM